MPWIWIAQHLLLRRPYQPLHQKFQLLQINSNTLSMVITHGQFITKASWWWHVIKWNKEQHNKRRRHSQHCKTCLRQQWQTKQLQQNLSIKAKLFYCVKLEKYCSYSLSSYCWNLSVRVKLKQCCMGLPWLKWTTLNKFYCHSYSKCNNSNGHLSILTSTLQCHGYYSHQGSKLKKY